MSYQDHAYQYSAFGSSRVTWAVQRLIVLNTVVFALQLALAPILMMYSRVLPIGGTELFRLEPWFHLEDWLGFTPSYFLKGYIFQPITYQFLHMDLSHLFTNMLCLYFFGPDVERLLSTRKFYFFYFFCGAAGVMLTVLFYLLYGPSSNPCVMGASGSILGVLIAFALIDPDRQFYLFPLPVPLNARALVIIFILMQVLMALRGDGNVSVATHFGGMAAGFVYMKFAPMFNTWKRERRRAKSSGKRDPVAEAVDNIFNFDKKKKH